MARPLPRRVGTWVEADWHEFFRLLGLKLQEMAETGQVSNVSPGVHGVAADAFEDVDEATAFGDDILNDNLYSTINSYDAGALVWESWTGGGTGSAEGIRILDFGTGKVFVYGPVNTDVGSSDDLIDVIDPEDQEARRAIVLEYLSQGRLAQELSVDDCVTREEIHKTYARALDQGLNSDWESLAMLMEWNAPIDSSEQRHALLDAYLDSAIQRM